MRQFKTSSRFGLIGVFVVMAVCAVVALNMDQADPKDGLALIFAIVAIYIILLFYFQTRDLSKAEAADAQAFDLKPADIDNPAKLDEPQLYAALAVKPIDVKAIRARKEIWGTARQSIRLGMVICLLIFLSVPPIYLLDTWVPLMIGAPLIIGIALWKSVRLLASGGDVDKAYDLVDVSMAPLGLTLVERPEVIIEPKSVAPYRVGAGLIGQLLLHGERHGRAVTVRMPTTEGRQVSEVRVAVESPEFEFRARDGRLKAEESAPQEVKEALRRVPNSTRWNGVKGGAGEDGIEIRRKGLNVSDWLLDLWLAERLAGLVSPRRTSLPSAR